MVTQAVLQLVDEVNVIEIKLFWLNKKKISQQKQDIMLWN